VCSQGKYLQVEDVLWSWLHEAERIGNVVLWTENRVTDVPLFRQK
jgi:hypothetical protein